MVLRLDESIEVEARASLPPLSAHKPCNPSLIVRDDTILCVYKGINFDIEKEGYRFTYGGYSVPFCDSQNYVAELDMDLKVRGAHFLEDRHIRARPFALHGLQDLRLFARRDGLWCMGAAATHEAHPWSCAPPSGRAGRPLPTGGQDPEGRRGVALTPAAGEELDVLGPGR
jgi:hypothetical protein